MTQQVFAEAAKIVFKADVLMCQIVNSITPNELDRLSNEARLVILLTSARRVQWNGHKCRQHHEDKTTESWYYVYESAADDV